MKVFFKKSLIHLCVLFIIASSSFLLIYLIPGDPVDFILKEGADLQDKNLLRQELGLDKPFIQQYTTFLNKLIHLDMGHSIPTGEPVFEVLKTQVPFTFNLAFFSLLLSFLWGIPFGILSAHPAFKKYEKFFDLFPVLFFSVPAFVVAPLLIWFFGVYLMWLPISGAGGFSYLILPAVSLALPLGAVLMKVTRASILEVLHLDYVRTAKAKGARPFAIYFQHTLKNALIPIVTIMGLQMGALLTGTVIIETIFDRPGVGSLLYRAITSRDYPLIQATVLFIALVYVFVNRFTDWVYTRIHPQMRVS